MMTGFANFEMHEVQETREAKGTGSTAERIIQRERWPGAYVGGQRVQCVPLVTSGQVVAANQPILRLEYAPSFEGQKVSGSERHDETVLAGLAGHVLGTTARGGVLLESHANVIAGALGVGNQIAGVLTTMHVQDEAGMSGAMSKLPAGAILAIPEPLTFAVLRRAIISGVAGIIGGSIALSDLEGFLHVDLLSLIDSTNIEQAQVHMPAMTIMLTEGIGHIPMPAPLFAMLEQNQATCVLLSGMTSTRYHLLPELLISASPQKGQEKRFLEKTEEEKRHQSLKIGTRVRVTCGTQQGTTGRLEYFFLHEQLFPSGIMSRAIRLRLDSGDSLMVPLIHVEPIEDP